MSVVTHKKMNVITLFTKKIALRKTIRSKIIIDGPFNLCYL